MSNPDLLCSLDGRISPVAEATVSITDDGFLRGDGAFEMLRLYGGTPFALTDHMDRLERSTDGIFLEWDRPAFEREIGALLEANAKQEAALRLVLSRGGRRLALTEPLPPTPEQARLAYVTYAPTHLLDGVKSLSYAANMLATRCAKERGFDEALLVTPHGRVLEAPTSTIFWCGGDGVLATPPLEEHILASITRAYVMEVTEAEERVCTKEELEQASEAFLASTTREVQPIAQIEEIEFEAPGKRTRAAAEGLRARIQEALAAGG